MKKTIKEGERSSNGSLNAVVIYDICHDSDLMCPRELRETDEIPVVERGDSDFPIHYCTVHSDRAIPY